MLSYDGITSHFEINPYFKGAWFHNSLPGGNADAMYIPMLDADGKQMIYQDGSEEGAPMYLVKPSIKKIAFTVGDYDLRIDENGGYYIGENSSIHKIPKNEVHLVNKAVNGTAIMDGMALAGVERQMYPRIGLSFLTFTYDWPTVHEKEVRQAIAWCMDRDQLTQDYCGAVVGDFNDGVAGDNNPADDEDILTADDEDLLTAEDEKTEEEPEEEPEEAEDDEDRLNAFDLPTKGSKEEKEPVTNSLGVTVDGYYGIAQWEYLLVTHQLSYPVNLLDEVLPEVHDLDEEEEALSRGKGTRVFRTQAEYDNMIAAWESLSLDDQLVHYTVDINKANALLDYAGWTLNEQGEAYRPGVDEVRCKMVDDELVALRLKMMYPEGNHIVDTLQVNFIDNLNQAGITLELVPTPMQDLLYSYYREAPRTTDMIYLATNFHIVVDPSITYSTDDTLNHQIWNNTYSDDEELWSLARDMRKTDPMDVFGYVGKWISFQKRYNEVLPTIPIYSNTYADFYTPMLQNYDIDAQVTWSQAIILAYFGTGESEAEAGEEETPEEDDDSLF